MSQSFEVLDVFLQQLSQIEHYRSDLRYLSPDDTRDQARNEVCKMTMTVPGSSGTSQTNYTAEQNYAMNTTRVNAIASLIVLANMVPVHKSRTFTPTIANKTRR